jgi:hypothetical protein
MAATHQKVYFAKSSIPPRHFFLFQKFSVDNLAELLQNRRDYMGGNKTKRPKADG